MMYEGSTTFTVMGSRRFSLVWITLFVILSLFGLRPNISLLLLLLHILILGIIAGLILNLILR